MEPAEIHDLSTKKMPTGISSLDPMMEGGIPPGSVILLLSEIGAGSYEFIYSSILSISSKKSKNPVSDTLLIPSSIRYVTFTKMSEDVKREMKLSFYEDLLSGMGSIQFDDLSQLYFDASVVPIDWYSKGDIVSRLQNRNNRDILSQLSLIFVPEANNSLIVLDSLTDLATEYAGTPRWGDLMAFMRGLQRIAKQLNTTIYLPLAQGILDVKNEREIADIADAVIYFHWEESTAARRQRVMYFEKFRGLMPHLEEKDLVKFSVRISSAIGFEVSNIRVII
jgi:KaiC/GvpD/RAD55 family RecA-like ATPase